jgi:hypothetical protein
VVSIAALFIPEQGPATNITVDANLLLPESGLPSQPSPDANEGKQGCSNGEERLIAGWGPDRPSFPEIAEIGYTTFNSVRDNPNVGDERNFYVVRDADDGVAVDGEHVWFNSVEVKPNHTYVVRLFVRNDGSGVDGFEARDTKISVSLPTCTGTQIASNGFVTSPDAFPWQTWGGILFTSDQQFNLVYVPGSAILGNNGAGADGGVKLPDSFLTAAGAQIGFDRMDGVIRGGHFYASYILFEVRPQFAR